MNTLSTIELRGVIVYGTVKSVDHSQIYVEIPGDRKQYSIRNSYRHPNDFQVGENLKIKATFKYDYCGYNIFCHDSICEPCKKSEVVNVLEKIKRKLKSLDMELKELFGESEIKK